MPMHRRMPSGVTPAVASSASVSWRWVVLCLLLWAQGWAEPVLTGGALVDIRYGDLLLDTIDEGLNLDARGVSTGLLNGREVPLEKLPRDRAAFVRWDDTSGRVLRVEVIDPTLERESVQGAADLWQVSLKSGGPFRLGFERTAPRSGAGGCDPGPGRKSADRLYPLGGTLAAGYRRSDIVSAHCCFTGSAGCKNNQEQFDIRPIHYLYHFRR